MKITNNQIQKILKSYNNQQVNKNGVKSSKLSKKDELSLSSEAKDFQIAMNALKRTPDVRKEKVQEIKRQVETGTYQVDSGKIVERILESTSLYERI